MITHFKELDTNFDYQFPLDTPFHVAGLNYPALSICIGLLLGMLSCVGPVMFIVMII